MAARGQRPAHPQQRVHVPRRPDRRHDYFSHRLVIPFRAACTPLRRARRASCPRAPHLPAWLPPG
nr:hypothetical protein [Burkholderia pseudomallei]